jgi:hypothetical protein
LLSGAASREVFPIGGRVGAASGRSASLDAESDRDLQRLQQLIDRPNVGAHESLYSEKSGTAQLDTRVMSLSPQSKQKTDRPRRLMS